MGAFIAYLHRALGIRHFFVLAPNLTIYDKLIRDFTPNTPKYVFQGLAEFAMQSARDHHRRQLREPGAGPGSARRSSARSHVNIFNISKINAEVRGGKAPRIKRLSECIGESYFEYLAALRRPRPDHGRVAPLPRRCRRARPERAAPILGLELTATPQIERGGRSERVPERHLRVPAGRGHPGRLREGARRRHARGLRPGEPSARTSSSASSCEDGVILHEHTKAHLQVYATSTASAGVKPFVLVIAQDTDARRGDRGPRSSRTISSRGATRTRSSRSHSNQRGEERDETVQALLRSRARMSPPRS